MMYHIHIDCDLHFGTNKAVLEALAERRDGISKYGLGWCGLIWIPGFIKPYLMDLMQVAFLGRSRTIPGNLTLN